MVSTPLVVTRRSLFSVLFPLSQLQLLLTYLLKTHIMHTMLMFHSSSQLTHTVHAIPLSDETSVTDGTSYICWDYNDLSYHRLHNTVSVCHHFARGARDGSRERESYTLSLLRSLRENP
jgi:hypothetical protein